MLRLAAVLRRVPKWVLSYDLCPEVEGLYSWARIEPVETCYTTAKTRGANKRAGRREVVVGPQSDRAAPAERVNGNETLLILVY